MSAGSRLRILALPLALGLVACGARQSTGVAPGVLLIVVDALRADHMSAYGYDRDTTPILRELAREGLRFEQVFASAPLLIPAHTAILTGCEPGVARRFQLRHSKPRTDLLDTLRPRSEQGIEEEEEDDKEGEVQAPGFEGLNERRWAIPARAPRLAVEFLAAGYATAAFVDHEFLSEATGFGLGFQRYEILESKTAEKWEGPQSTRAVDHFLQWLGTVPPGRPWFAYVHMNQLERCWSETGARNDGYFQPRPGLEQIPPVANTDSVFFAIPRSRWRGGVRSLGQYEAEYDDEIRKADAEIGRLGASLRRMGRYESTSLHVLGSLGLQLGEAGMILSSGRYSMADLAVPWILRPRAGLAASSGRSVPGLVSTLDVAPTLLALEGLPVPEEMSGASQAAAVRKPGAATAERPYVFASCGLQEGCAVIGVRHVLEYILPRGMADAQLRRSWVGEWSDQGPQPRLFFYDRLKSPFPPLDGGWDSEREAELPAFRATAVEWLRAVNEERIFLQAPASGTGEEAAALQRAGARALREAAQ